MQEFGRELSRPYNKYAVAERKKLTMAFIATQTSVSSVMLKVLFALVPAIAIYQLYFGPAILVSLALASITAISAETLILRVRRLPVMPFLMDGSALVTAWLLALSMPPLAPWWLIVIATLFAIIIDSPAKWLTQQAAFCCRARKNKSPLSICFHWFTELL